MTCCELEPGFKAIPAVDTSKMFSNTGKGPTEPWVVTINVPPARTAA
jgi:hypothetical protein